MDGAAKASLDPADRADGSLWDLIGAIQVAMMTTSGEDGALRSRPMATRQKDFKGTLWFFTHAPSGKTDEIAEDARVNLAYADPGADRYVSVSGRARVARDRALIERHWDDDLRTWFAGGKDDPEIALIAVHVDTVESWDRGVHVGASLI